MDLSTYSNDGPECPYCGRQFVPDESYYYDANAFTEMECDECRKTFNVEVHHSVSWRCDAIPEAAARDQSQGGES